MINITKANVVSMPKTHFDESVCLDLFGVSSSKGVMPNIYFRWRMYT